jgi:hypothetical protein
MPIQKAATTPNGATLGFHRATDLTINMINATAFMRVLSHIDEAAYLADLPHAWTWGVAVPLASLTADVITSAEQALIVTGESPFFGGSIVSDESVTLIGAKTRKVALLREACTQQIVSGFPSAALGAQHTYPAKPQDQANLTGSVLASLLPGNPANWSTPFWCADAAGAWAYQMHTAAQIQQVGQDAKAAIVTALVKNETLAAQVAAATTQSAVNAITWA